MVFLYYKRFRGDLVLTDIILWPDFSMREHPPEKVFEQFYAKVFTNTFKGI